MSETFLSRFTPSLSNPESLIAITTGRDKELSRAIELLSDSIKTSAKHHVLFVGPRGIGKTHLISLISHYLGKDETLENQMLKIWFKEEEWGISSFLDLLIRILGNLAETEQADITAADIESLYDLDAGEAEAEAKRLLKDTASGKTLVLLAENLDEIFKGLGEEGQQKFRSFIQENPFMTIVATTQSLFAGVTSQTEPFYGFFRVYHLEVLAFYEAVEMLIKIAHLKKDKELVAYLKTAEGRGRVRAVHHLVGGNPRLYVIFSEFINRQEIEDLVTPFMKMLDGLTPYYQERMRWLSPQQRQIVEIMCDVGKPLTVKEIARRAFISHQTASGQLKQLREHSYVEAKQLGRESFYELREPLMRLTVEVKKNRGEPIRLLVDFLRFWYSPEEIENQLDHLGGKPCLESDYLKKAHQELLSQADDPRITACKADYNDLVNKKDFKGAMEVADELLAIKSSTANWFIKWSLSDELGLSDETEEAEKLLRKTKPKDAYDFYFKGEYYSRRNYLTHAVSSFNRAIEMKPDMAEAWSALTNSLIRAGNYHAALETSARALELEPENINNWYYRASVKGRLGPFDEARDVYQKVIDLDPGSYKAWSNMGWLHCTFKKFSDALVYLDKALEMNPRDVNVLTNRGWALAGMDRHEEAATEFNRVLEVDPRNIWAFNNLGWSLLELNRLKEALSHFEEYVRRDPKNEAAWDGLSQVLLLLERYQEAAAAAESALKVDRQCSRAWSTHGISQSLLGRHGGALMSFEQAMKTGDHSAITLFYKAVALVATGRDDEGFVELDHAFYHACRVHGINLKNIMHLFKLLYEQFEEKWNEFVPRIIEPYIKNSLANRLGAALVKFLFQLLENEADKIKVGNWVSMWRKYTAEYPALEFSDELLETAWLYAQNKDESVLYNLPVEERKLITDFMK